MKRRKTFYLWGVIQADGKLMLDPWGTPYLWGDRAEARLNADVLPGLGADKVQRLKVVIEGAGMLHRVYPE